MKCIASPGDSEGAQIGADLLNRIIFQDDTVLVINKPSGLAVQGGSNQKYSIDKLMAERMRSIGTEPPRSRPLSRLFDQHALYFMLIYVINANFLNRKVHLIISSLRHANTLTAWALCRVMTAVLFWEFLAWFTKLYALWSLWNPTSHFAWPQNCLVKDPHHFDWIPWFVRWAFTCCGTVWPYSNWQRYICPVSHTVKST